MHRDDTDNHSIGNYGITDVGAMLGDWLAANTSLTHMEYVLCCVIGREVYDHLNCAVHVRV